MLDAAERLMREQPWDACRDLRAAVPRLAMNALWRGGDLRPLAAEVLRIASAGLRARACLERGCNEEPFFNPLYEIAAGGPTHAETWLEKYATVWNFDPARVFGEQAI